MTPFTSWPVSDLACQKMPKNTRFTSCLSLFILLICSTHHHRSVLRIPHPNTAPHCRPRLPSLRLTCHAMLYIFKSTMSPRASHRHNRPVESHIPFSQAPCHVASSHTSHCPKYHITLCHTSILASHCCKFRIVSLHASNSASHFQNHCVASLQASRNTSYCHNRHVASNRATPQATPTISTIFTPYHIVSCLLSPHLLNRDISSHASSRAYTITTTFTSLYAMPQCAPPISATVSFCYIST